MPKPIIFLAFANDQEDKAHYLRTLSVEANQIANVLRQAEREGLCEIILRQNIGIAEIIQTFQDSHYQDRIAIFHYGGHADGYQLLLNSMQGNNEIAYGGGLVSFLAGQKGLALIFFNGCSTQQQSEELAQKGIPMVIGTSQAISDMVATDLAVSFYKGLGQGHTLARAWTEAIDTIKTKNNTDNFRGLYRKDKAVETDRFPWEIYMGIGKEKIKDWNLPDAAENPLFGLPGIPAHFNKLLPESPFRFLERYQAQHTRLFFGRAYVIRELYDKIKHKLSAPMLLFYGQSGAGKSSLLEAGLLPRLESEYQVIYLRRNPQTGLIGTLKEALVVGEKSKEGNQKWISEIEKLLQQENIQEVAKQQLTQLLNQYKTPNPAPSLAEAWLQKEENQKPLILILDQAEELFTQKKESKSTQNAENEELHEFLEALATIFVQTSKKPQGKLILSYRKEYQAEFEEAFRQKGLPKEKVFLQRLSEREIREVVLGISKDAYLKAHYRLTIEEGLDELIATELSQDLDSPVAPILQILLSKLWKEAKEDEAKGRVFTKDLYQQLRSKGILLTDFFNEQMQKIQVAFVELDRLGAPLDLLNLHTTPIGTAGSKTLEELRNIYGTQAEKFDRLQALKEKFTQLQLLTAPDKNNQISTLAHDSLAPVVQNAFRQSEKIVPRALRILENKVSESAYQPDNFLAEDELEIVEQAENGMRLWNAKEQALIERSREKKATLKAERKKAKRNRQLLRAFFIAFTVFASFMWDKNNRESNAGELATKSLQMESIDPTQALRLAEQAYQVWENPNFLQIINSILSKHQFYQQNFEGHTSRVVDVAFSPDSKYILSASQDSTARLWDLEGKLLQTFKHPTFVRTAEFWLNNTIQTSGADSMIYTWDREGKLIEKTKGTKEVVINEQTTFDFPIDSTLQQKLTDVRTSAYAFSPDKKQVAISYRYPKNIAELYEVSSGTLLKTFVAHTDEVSSVAFSPNGKYILTGSYDKTLKLWNMQGREEWKTSLENRPMDLFLENENTWVSVGKNLYRLDNKGMIKDSFMLDLENTTLLKREKTLFLALDTILAIMDFQSKKIQKTIPLKSPIRKMAWGADLIALDQDNNVLILSKEGKTIKTLQAHQNTIMDLNFSPNSNYLLSVGYDSTAIVWDTKTWEKRYTFRQNEVFSTGLFLENETILLGDWSGRMYKINLQTQEKQPFQVAKDFVNQIVLMPDGESILVASFDKNIYHCNLNGEILQTFAGHSDSVEKVAISADGTYFVSLSLDNTLIKWLIDPLEYLNSGRGSIYWKD